jgi:hypothetical protein
MKKFQGNNMTQKYKKIYVVCPERSKTGGTELLHQLVYQLNELGGNAEIAYCTDNKSQLSIIKGFEEYISSYISIEDIVDNERNAIVIPEYYPKFVLRFKKCKKYLWWLSVDNFRYVHTGLDGAIFENGPFLGLLCVAKRIAEKRFYNDIETVKKADYHLCQSFYAIDYLKKIGINSNIEYLSDYINDIYVSNYNNIDNSKKENIVLYNPKKGYEFTRKIIKKSPHLNWTPIQNLTTEQVQNLMAKSKVYIDFGNFPGKDRFPREASMSGCCIITGKRGAAAFQEDVPIYEKYKFDDIQKNIPLIIDCINKCLHDFNDSSRDFDEYRHTIAGEKEKFVSDVKKIFFIEG